MELIAKADVVLALGTRLNPVLDAAGLRHRLLAEGREDHPGRYQRRPDRADQESRRSASQGDARQVAEQILAPLAPAPATPAGQEREALIAQTRSAWLQQLASMDHEDDDPGTTLERARARGASGPDERRAWPGARSWRRCRRRRSSRPTSATTAPSATPTRRSRQGRKYLAPGLFGPCGYGFPSILGAKIGCPDVPVVGFAGDGAFGISMNEMTACGRDEWPAITMVIFRNYQWGAEKRNTTLWFDDNFVGTELDPDVSYARHRRACGLEGRAGDARMEALTEALRDGGRGADEATASPPSSRSS